MPFPANGKVMIHLVLMWLDEITCVEYPTWIATELSMILCNSGHHRPPTSGIHFHVLHSCFSEDDQKITFLKEGSILGLQFCVQDRPQIGIL